MKNRNLKKWMYDFLLSICSLIVVVACLIHTMVLEPHRVKLFLARPDTYMALWLAIMGILCLLLMRRALVARKTEEGQQDSAPIWSSLGVFTVVVLGVYLLFLELMGFILSSTLLMWALSGVYTFRIGAKKNDFRDKKVLTAMLIKTGIFSFVTSYFTYWIFTAILSASLPTFSLF
ncbi:hypothetical protein FACS1894206_10030 [Deltaproteobacteria bacterium]|nr:hypothetical protein FACS1894206_10030 [Deltaproteobacteria bacterium]